MKQLSKLYSKKIFQLLKNHKFFFILLGIFILQMIYFTFSIEKYFPPDEKYHLFLIKLHELTLNPIIENPEWRGLNDVSRQPFLYHYISSIILRFNFLQISEILYIRFFSVIIGIGYFAFIYKTAILLTNKKKVSILTVALLLLFNMVSLSFASISYDVFANFFGVLTIYFLLKFLKYEDLNDLLLTLSFSFLGALSKMTFIPLILAIVIVLSAFFIFKILYLKESFIQKLFKDVVNKKLVITFFLITLLPTLYFYGVNLIQYGSLVPECTQVATEEYCDVSGPWKRNEDLMKKFDENPTELINIFEFGYRWSDDMLAKSLGIFIAHFTYSKTLIKLVFLSLSVLGIARFLYSCFKRIKPDPYIIISLFIAFFYVLSVFYYNYTLYTETGFYGLAIQGRYMFPVFYLFIIFVAKNLLDYKQLQKSLVLNTLVIILLICSAYNIFSLNQILPHNTRLDLDKIYEYDLRKF